jgi:hypothetical protein
MRITVYNNFNRYIYKMVIVDTKIIIVVLIATVVFSSVLTWLVLKYSVKPGPTECPNGKLCLHPCPTGNTCSAPGETCQNTANPCSGSGETCKGDCPASGCTAGESCQNTKNPCSVAGDKCQPPCPTCPPGCAAGTSCQPPCPTCPPGCAAGTSCQPPCPTCPTFPTALDPTKLYTISMGAFSLTVFGGTHPGENLILNGNNDWNTSNQQWYLDGGMYPGFSTNKNIGVVDNTTVPNLWVGKTSENPITAMTFVNFPGTNYYSIKSGSGYYLTAANPPDQSVLKWGPAISDGSQYWTIVESAKFPTNSAFSSWWNSIW